VGSDVYVAVDVKGGVEVKVKVDSLASPRSIAMPGESDESDGPARSDGRAWEARPRHAGMHSHGNCGSRLAVVA
jgi:hypothetical protein